MLPPSARIDLWFEARQKAQAAAEASLRASNRFDRAATHAAPEGSASKYTRATGVGRPIALGLLNAHLPDEVAGGGLAGMKVATEAAQQGT